MKVDLYLDINPGFGIPDHGFYASSQPGHKIDGWKRIKITAEIPNYVITGGFDMEAPEVKTEVLDNSSPTIKNKDTE